MHTDQMHYFLTTVSCLNMTEAAEQLNISQSALSRSISSMESELGVHLFIRDKGKALRLSAEGAAVYRHLSGIYADYQRMMQEVENVRLGLTGKLSLGFLEGQMLDGQLKQILNLFSEKYPQIKLDVTRDTEHGLVQRLQEMTLDAAIMVELQAKEKKDIIYSPLFLVPTQMIVPKNHPLAGRECVSLRELKDDTFVYTMEPEISKRLVEHCRQAGFEPKIKFVDSMREQWLCLEMGQGIAGYNEYHSCYYSPNVTAFRVEELPEVPFVLAWNRQNFNPAIAMLDVLARSVSDAD